MLALTGKVVTTYLAKGFVSQRDQRDRVSDLEAPHPSYDTVADRYIRDTASCDAMIQVTKKGTSTDPLAHIAYKIPCRVIFENKAHVDRELYIYLDGK